MLCFGYLCTNVFVLCFMSIVLRGVVYHPVVGWGPFLTFFMVSSCGFPAWGRFSKLRFRDGCFIGVVSCVRRSFSVAL